MSFLRFATKTFPEVTLGAAAMDDFYYDTWNSATFSEQLLAGNELHTARAEEVSGENGAVIDSVRLRLARYEGTNAGADDVYVELVTGASPAGTVRRTSALVPVQSLPGGFNPFSMNDGDALHALTTFTFASSFTYDSGERLFVVARRTGQVVSTHGLNIMAWDSSRATYAPGAHWRLSSDGWSEILDVDSEFAFSSE